MAEELVRRELTLNRFRRLLAEMTRGELPRNSYQPWEIGILLDFHDCVLPGKRRTEILRQYLRAVTRQMQSGPGPPMKLSEFLQLREQRRETLRSVLPGDLQSGTGVPAPDE